MHRHKTPGAPSAHAHMAHKLTRTARRKELLAAQADLMTQEHPTVGHDKTDPRFPCSRVKLFAHVEGVPALSAEVASALAGILDNWEDDIVHGAQVHARAAGRSTVFERDVVASAAERGLPVA